MKQSDILIITVIILIAGILFIILKEENTNSLVAKVYYENELKLTIDFVSCFNVPPRIFTF